MPLGTLKNQYKFGRGEIFIDLLDANGATTGEFSLGNSPGFELSVTSDKYTHRSSMSGISKIDFTVIRAVDFAASITVDNVSYQNMALFIAGTTATITQLATPVTNEPHTVLRDREYQLGVSATHKMGVTNVSAVNVTNTAGTTTYALNTDYLVDEAAGRIYIQPNSTITPGQIIHIDYTPAAGTYQMVSSGAGGSLDAAIRFKADNPTGSNDDLYIASATLAPSGALPFITEDEVASFTFDVGINEKDSNTPQVQIRNALAVTP
jgi:hypothetical protein